MTIWDPRPLDPAKPLYLALAESLERDVQAGVMGPGERLPPQRGLAQALGVTVGTVGRAYAEAERRGLVKAGVGRGTFVAPGPEPDFFAQGHGGTQGIDLGLTRPLEHLNPDPGPHLAAMAVDGFRSRLMGYGPFAGHERHRKAGSRWLAGLGVRAGPDNVVVCAGGQHALNVVLLALFRNGDRIAVDRYTYPGFKDLAARLGLRLAPVPGDDGGMIPEELEKVLARDKISGIYLMPGVHNPSAVGLSPARREALVFLARKRDLAIIEDDPYALLAEGAARPMAALAPERTVHLASLSKSLAGGLRVSYAAAPDKWLEPLGKAVGQTMWMASPLAAELAARLVTTGEADRVLAAKKAEASARCRLARSVLSAKGVSARCSALFAWTGLPEPWTGESFAQAAMAQGLALIPGSRFLAAEEGDPPLVRLSLGSEPGMDTLAKGLETIRDLACG